MCLHEYYLLVAVVALVKYISKVLHTCTLSKSEIDERTDA